MRAQSLLGMGALTLSLALAAAVGAWSLWPTVPWPVGGEPLSRADAMAAPARPEGPDAVALGRALVATAPPVAMAGAWRQAQAPGQPVGPLLGAWLKANRAQVGRIAGAAKALAARPDGVVHLEEADAVASLARLGQVACLAQLAQGRPLGGAQRASDALALSVAAAQQVAAEPIALALAQARRDRLLGWAWGLGGAWPPEALEAWASGLDQALAWGDLLPRRLRALLAHQHQGLLAEAEAEGPFLGWVYRPAFRVLGHQAWALGRRDQAAMAWPEQAVAHLTEGGQLATWRQPLLAFWVPELWPALVALRAYEQDQREAQAELLALRLRVAVLRHRQREGRAPAALMALVPRDLPRWPEDPFAPGQPLRQAGGRAWSVAWDGADQGGQRGVVVEDRGHGRYRFDSGSTGDLLLWPPHSFPARQVQAPAAPR